MKRKVFLEKSFRVLVFTVVAALAGWFSKLLSIQFKSKLRFVTVPVRFISEKLYLGKGFIIHQDKNDLQVLSRHCPHLGCSLQSHVQSKQIVCPCHGSRFTEDGVYIQGPAKKNMNTLNFTLNRDETLKIQLD